ncbi:LuxR family transcriptional regulator [Pseudarthrobacter sulfonivorans]|jgi:hypothetical protein|uniref:LuxR family transcriptional regulator n=1 Tax=Pseudarthrobacter sulfonivorans TaxID=121292 RepID=UPI00278736CA|nr:LuxR family transcriptional regulator [Pseudarthrobacter sulfonivorans]MDQ0000665.1 hypothetical protein [Pseudarthrobacter sulfonivorans]
MIQKFLRGCLGLLLAGSAQLTATPALAGTWAIGTRPLVAHENVFAPLQDGLSLSASSSPTTTPSSPVDAGTGETGEAKETRVEYAPYVIGGIVAVALVAAVLFWRKRRISHPAKPD